MKATSSHTPSVARPSQGLSASSTPAAVATPLPPWKRKKTGQRCPSKAASPVGSVSLSSRLIDGQFPNHSQLLPESYEHEVKLPPPGIFCGTTLGLPGKCLPI